MQLARRLLENPTLFAYLLGANNYTWIQFQNGEKHLIAKPLTYFEEQLPAFIRVHKTALVNPACVVGVTPPPRPKMAGSLQMSDGATLPVSRRRWPQVSEFLAAQTNSVASTVPVEQPSPKQSDPHLIAVMSGDALLLTQQCLERLSVPCRLQALEQGGELATALLFDAPRQWPALVLLDARVSRADRLRALHSLKGHPHLRSIPVVWLASPTDDPLRLYEQRANSVIMAPTELAAFRQTIDQLFQYWLQMVHLPPELMRT